jgi:hypothetical protein
MSTAQQIAELVLHADTVHAYEIKADGSRGEEYEVKEWNQCDFSEFDLGSFRVIYGSKFELWYDELEDAEIDGNIFKVNGIEVVVSPDSE